MLAKSKRHFFPSLSRSAGSKNHFSWKLSVKGTRRVQHAFVKAACMILFLMRRTFWQERQAQIVHIWTDKTSTLANL